MTTTAQRQTHTYDNNNNNNNNNNNSSNNNNNNYDMYISFARQDFQWVREFVVEVERRGFTVCWNNSGCEDEWWISKCSVCLLVFSHHYISQEEEWETFTQYTNYHHPYHKPHNAKHLLCLLIATCQVPEDFSEEIVFDWTEVQHRESLWSRLVECLQSARKRRDDAGACGDVVEASPSADANFEFSWADRLYPQYISDSFVADEDLSKEDVAELTFKPEDVETLLEMAPTEKEKRIEVCSHREVRKKSLTQLQPFSSSDEQFKVVNILQNIHDGIQNKLSSTSCNATSKRRYRRLSTRFTECIFQAVNGEQDVEKLSGLPLFDDLFNDDVDVFRCTSCRHVLINCLDLFELDLHLETCVLAEWKDLLNFEFL